MSETTVLLITSDQEAIESFRHSVVGHGIQLEVADTMADVAKRLFSRRFDVLFVQTDALASGQDPALADTVMSGCGIPVVAVSRNGTIRDAVRAVRAGACDYVTTPVDPETLPEVVQRARAERTHARRAAMAPAALDGCFSCDRRMLAVHNMIIRVAPLAVPTLIVGESGAGKSFLAHKLHQLSPRRAGPFVKVLCGAFETESLGAELFGQGVCQAEAACGQPQGRAGLANGGTLLLHRVNDNAVSLLPCLLGRNGSRRTGSDFRLVLTSAAAASSEVCRGVLRNCAELGHEPVVVQAPPLRERVSDIPLLAVHFAHRFSAKHNRRVTDISNAAMDRLVRHTWPGNVRELESAIEHGVMLSGRNAISVDDLPESVTGAQNGKGNGSRPPKTLPLKAALQESERAYLIRVLETSGWNKRQVAETLRVSRSTLYAKIRQHNLDAEYSPAGG